MRTKATTSAILFTSICGILGTAAWWLSREGPPKQADAPRIFTIPTKTASLEHTSITTGQSTTSITNEKRAVFLSERQRMSNGERVLWLERNGKLPDDADEQDWLLAEKTSWWGKPLDPREFWKGRVHWDDAEAVLDAERRGRRFPPPPFEDATLPAYPSDDAISRLDVIDSPNIHLASSSKESSFWDKFAKTKPNPPEKIEQNQIQVATRRYEGRYTFQAGGNPARTSPEGLAQMEESEKNAAIAIGCPPEALTDEALFWAQVLHTRQVYEKEVSRGQTFADHYIQRILKRSGIDQKLITEELSEEQLKLANKWKIIYLRRLRDESADEAYIDAYLKAWRLSAPDVFGP